MPRRENKPMVKMTNPVWAEIETALRARDKTQHWLANEIGVSTNAVTKWKQTGQISRENAMAVSVKLGIPLDKLLLGKENAIVEMLEALPLERSKAILNQLMYQIENAEDVLAGDQIGKYLSAMQRMVKDMEKRKR